MVVIEIKLRRTNGKSDSQWKKDLLKDITKIKELQSLVDSQARYYFIIFDKKNNIRADIPNDSSIQIIYRFENEASR